MEVRTTKRFEKQFSKLRSGDQMRVIQAATSFMIDPLRPSLRLHDLQAEWQGFQSISAGGDLRIHFKIQQEAMVLEAVGSHAQLYK